jgi:leucyl aminopeptidase
MRIEFVKTSVRPGVGEALAVTGFADGALSDETQAVDGQLDGALRRAIASSRFTGATDESLELLAPSGMDVDRIMLVGAGLSPLEAAAAELVGGKAVQAAANSGGRSLLIRITDPVLAAHAAFGARLGGYRFDKYRTAKAPAAPPLVERVRVATADPKAAAKTFEPLATLADAILLARDLVSEPSNVLHPVEFAHRLKALEHIGLGVEVLGDKAMAKLGMGALLGVGQGSERESQLVVLRWTGAADPAAAPVAFAGKGVCFDTGGISLKRPEGMEEMVYDMGGAAAAAGAMYALAARKARVNAVAVLGLVENMPGGNAQRPGDVVKTLSGQTVEVINTDAEGRLVLADALWYCQDRFKARFMVDLATLTGAIVTALGTGIAGLFCNDETLAEQLLAAARTSGEPLWRMPLPPEHAKVLESRVADLKNVGDNTGGAITAALFIQRFVNGLPWAHLDISGPVHVRRTPTPTHPLGPTGYGVRLLDRLVADFYEEPLSE